MNVRQVAFLIFVSVGLNLFSAGTSAQEVQIRGPKNSTSELSGSTYGPIKPTDTLWRIASRYRQNKNLSVYQIMQAIYDLNPDAFEDQNFNHMVDGAILKLPSERYAARIDPQQARLKAQQDDMQWQTATGTGQAAIAPSTDVSESAASKDDLSQTKQVIEDKLTELDEEQDRQFAAIRQQFAESINSVQSLLEDNRKLIDRLDVVDQEISSLKGRVDEEIQVQMDQMLTLQNELLAISKEAEAQRKAELEKSSFTWMTDPIFLFAITILLSISLLGALALWLIKRNQSSTTAEGEHSDAEFSPPVIEQSDEMDDLSDALSNELAEELDDDEDDLFADDDLLDDVLSEELQESLDDALEDELESFDDLGDEDLDPVIDEQNDSVDEDDDGMLDQDDLDSLFEEDPSDLLADIDDMEADLDETEDQQQNDSADADDDLDDLLSSTPAADDSSDQKTPSAVEAELPVEEPQEEDPLPSADEVEDEPEKPEISIDELLEEPQHELPESVLQDDSELISEEMLQNLDKEIASQNQQLDSITDELLNEIDQLEQMGDLLGDDEPELEQEDSVATVESQHSIQALDDLVEDLDEELDEPEDNDRHSETDQSSAELDGEDQQPKHGQHSNESAQEESLEQAEDESEPESLSEQQSISNSQVEDKSADEMLAELEQKSQQDPAPSEPEATDSLHPTDAEDEPVGQDEFDQALEEFEQFQEDPLDIEDEEASHQTDSAEQDPDESDDLGSDDVFSEEGEDQQSDDSDILDVESQDDDQDSELLTDLDDELPSVEDLDSLSDDELGEFDDADLEEALKAFDENFDETELHTPEATQTGNVDLDDLPGLGDWLSGEEEQSLDELENASFDELLDSLDTEEQEETSETSERPQSPDGLDDSGLDFDALLNDIEDETESSAQSDSDPDDDKDQFVDVDDLINDSQDSEFHPPKEKPLNLDAAFESYAGLSDGFDTIDVDGDNGVGAKLDLAQAYVEMDDLESAKALLQDVAKQGNEEQQQEAKELLAKLA